METLSKSSQEVIYSFAHAQYKQGLFKEAEGMFRLLTSADMEEKKYWMGLGLALQCSKRYQEAIETYDMVVALDPGNTHVHLQVAESFFALNQKEQGLYALDCAERAIKLQKEPEREQLLRLALLREAWSQHGKK